MEDLERPGFWRNRPTLVTGATGLVGGWLVKRLLAHEAAVVCLVRDWTPGSELIRSGIIDRVSVVRGDVRDQPLLERVLTEYQIDTVFHLAAQAIVTVANRHPAATFQSNIEGTWTVLEACRRAAVARQIVVASSDKAYGSQEQLPYREEAPLLGRHPYDASKACADLIAASYAASYQMPVAITRCGNFYGGGDLNWNRIVPGTIRSILENQHPVIRSNGEYVRDYFYVEDGSRAYMMLAEGLARKEAWRGEAFNFSCERPIKVLDLVKRILSLMDSPLEADVRNEASNEIITQYLSSQKAREWLNWRPQFSLDDGLRRTISWYRDYFRNPRG